MKHSPRVQRLIDTLTCLPGVGPRSAQRMAYHLLERNRDGGRLLAAAMADAMDGVQQCQRCRNFAEEALCSVCADPRRQARQVCVVASPADVLAIEQSGEYHGHYFVLMGQLSPLDGLGPRQLGLDVLEQRLGEGEIDELILATSTTVEGEATAHYIHDMVEGTTVSLSRIAQGVPMGGDLEYVDGATLAHAFRGRRPL
ncbi:recombination mediator RecR [Isoalcanivorax beigongshangi]|uniref:Recombination protein RecR n=1 Tax=Isoalcanivorax beigongshangi TaxID=3238810 RepID=A0ABV4AHE2_9GAMM